VNKESDQSLDWAIVIVNWNNWPDTLECLEGVMRMVGCHSRVILVDNDSTDDSIGRLLQWANGDICIIPESRDSMVSSLIKPPIEKPLDVMRVLPDDSPQSVGCFKNENRLFLLTARENRGFAAGNNLGIRFALDTLDCKIFWLINNDAVPQRDAFKELQRAFEGQNHPLICGTAIMDYHEPTKVQSCGGQFDFFMGSALHKYDGCDVSSLDEQPTIVKATYPVGASLVVHRDFITSVGFMDEGLFLYFEELSWMIAKGKPYEVPIATRSRVFHKGSTSTGFSHNLKKRNASVDYYIIRNRLLIGRQLGLANLLCFVAASFFGLSKRLLAGRFVLVLGGLKAIFDGLMGKTGRK
jgi:GT2 family glycosyltransferase